MKWADKNRITLTNPDSVAKDVRVFIASNPFLRLVGIEIDGVTKAVVGSGFFNNSQQAVVSSYRDRAGDPAELPLRIPAARAGVPGKIVLEFEDVLHPLYMAGIPLSAWVRERLRLTAIRELEGAGQRIPFIPEIPFGGNS